MLSESLESEDRVVWLNNNITHLIRLIGGREGGREGGRKRAEVEREGGRRRDVEREGGEEIKRAIANFTA